MSTTLSLADRAHLKMQSPVMRIETADVADDWWDSLTKDQQMAYLAAHPHSQKKSNGVKAVIDLLNPQQRKLVETKFRAAANEGFPKAAKDALNDEAVDALPPKETGAIAGLLRKAFSDPDRNARMLHGAMATTKLLAAAGIMVLASAAVISAGVPLSIFTPDLMVNVWTNIQKEVLAKDDAELVKDLAAKMQARVFKGFTDEEIAAAVMKGHHGDSGAQETPAADSGEPAAPKDEAKPADSADSATPPKDKAKKRRRGKGKRKAKTAKV
jgi:hypothetical protein